MAGDGQTSTAIQLSHYRAIEQRQQSLERAAIAGGGVELEGKSASIKSISECIQLSNALSLFSCSISLSSCFVLRSERSICISTTGSRRQLSIDKNERKGESDEPDAPLLLERELAVGEGDVDIGRKSAIRPTTVPTTASRNALPSNPSRHQGRGACRSREPPSTLSSPAQSRHPPV